MAFTKPTSFVTFGMFIVDEIEWQPPNNKKPVTDLMGGAGSYAILGARIASSPCQLLSKSISWIVDVGSDFPKEIKDTINKWNTDCIYRTDNSRLTTRAWNGYGDDEFRSFKYLTPKVRLDVDSLNERQIKSKSFHMVCSPQRCIDITTKLNAVRDSLGINKSQVVVWEPIPDVCSPDVLPILHQALQNCTVVSPNHDELKMFFAKQISEHESQIELVKRLMGWSNSSLPTDYDTVPIVREGSKGSTAYFKCYSTGSVCFLHIPAYHTAELSSSVIDPTGAGNTYLGALAIALTDALSGQPTYPLIFKFLEAQIRRLPIDNGDQADLRKMEQGFIVDIFAIAMIYATVAASFAIEQHGMPTFEQTRIFVELFEKWNGEEFIDRLRKYLERESQTIRAGIEQARRAMNPPHDPLE